VHIENHGWGRDTRIVGIYIDSLVESGDVERVSDFDALASPPNFLAPLARMVIFSPGRRNPTGHQ
jgi:hypothetical protein